MHPTRSKLLAFDAFSKTVEDAKIRTSSGGLITVGCFFLIIILIINDWRELNTVYLQPEISVDRDRAKKLDVNLDITFPHMPCDVITLDIMDSSGDVQLDITKSGFQKIRLTKDGQEIASEALEIGNQEGTEIMKSIKGSDYCGACYGARDGCCNSCEEVRQAYVAKVWAFVDGANVEQCEEEGYVKKINERIFEGCRIKGTSTINRISGNLHIAPGASYTGGSKSLAPIHFHDLSLFEKHKHLNFHHKINHLSFGPDPQVSNKVKNNEKLQSLMFSTHPLDGFEPLDKDSKYHVYSYFVKVVASRYEFLDHTFMETNQFSATRHDRPLVGGADDDHKHTLHSRGGIPAIYIFLDISPIKIINREVYLKTFGSFLLSICSVIGGVITLGAVLDRTIYETNRIIRSKKDT